MLNRILRLEFRKYWAASLILSTSVAFSAQPVKVIHLGLVSNFSEISHSSANPYVNAFKNGVNFAILSRSKELQQQGLQIRLQEFDYGTSPIRVLNAAKAAIASNVIAAVGYNFSSHALIAAPLHQEARLAMISPSATADRLSSFSRYVHRVCFSNSAMGRALAEFARSRLNARKAAVVVAADCAYCEDLGQAFEKEFSKTLGEVVVVSKVLETDTDFSKTVNLLKGRPFDVVLVPNQELASARIIASLVRGGIKKPFLGGDGWGDRGEEFLTVLRNSPVPIAFQGYSISHWHADLRSTLSEQFMKGYARLYRQKPNDTAVLAYDAMSLLIQALLQTQNHTREGVERSLARIQQFEGVTGRAQFDGGGTPLKTLILLSTAHSSRTQENLNFSFKMAGKLPIFSERKLAGP